MMGDEGVARMENNHICTNQGSNSPFPIEAVDNLLTSEDTDGRWDDAYNLCRQLAADLRR